MKQQEQINKNIRRKKLQQIPKDTQRYLEILKTYTNNSKNQQKNTKKTSETRFRCHEYLSGHRIVISIQS